MWSTLWSIDVYSLVSSCLEEPTGLKGVVDPHPSDGFKYLVRSIVAKNEHCDGWLNHHTGGYNITTTWRCVTGGIWPTNICLEQGIYITTSLSVLKCSSTIQLSSLLGSSRNRALHKMFEYMLELFVWNVGSRTNAVSDRDCAVVGPWGFEGRGRLVASDSFDPAIGATDALWSGDFL